MPFLRLSLVVLACSLLLLPVTHSISAPADTPPPAAADFLSPEAIADFQWMDTLGFPSLHDCPLVRVSVGWWSRGGGNFPSGDLTTDAFLLEHDDHGGFRVLATSLFGEGTYAFSSVGQDAFTARLQSTPPDTTPLLRVGYEERSLTEAADARIAAFRPPPPPEQSTHDDEWVLERQTDTFFWAWACWQHGLYDRASLLYRQALLWLPSPRTNPVGLFRAQLLQGLPLPSPGQNPSAMVVRARLETGFCRAFFREANLECGNLRLPRARLLEDFDRIVRLFPGCQEWREARALADHLRTMLAEDAAHPALDEAAVAALPVDRQVAEWIFHLRDQAPPLFYHPYPLEADAPPDTPATYLAALGFPAVPALLDALEDPRPARGCIEGYLFRSSASSRCSVVTVGDLALATLEHIAGREFRRSRRGTDAHPVRWEADLWWNEVQSKGGR